MSSAESRETLHAGDFTPARYRKRIEPVLRHIADRHAAGELDEQGVPSYVAGIILSRWVVWRRVAAIVRMLGGVRGEACLDFGCGTGIMFPALARSYATVHAVDVVPEPGREFLSDWQERYGERLDVRIAASIADTGIAAGSLDLVLALEVLEHVESVPETIERLLSLLKPDGRIIITAPTENAIYRIGRRIVGFSGVYHHRDAADIRRAIEKRAVIAAVRRIPFIVPFYYLFEVRSR